MNTDFFHNTAKQRTDRNNICSLIDEEGEIIHDPAIIEGRLVEHFKSLFVGTSSGEYIRLEDIQNLINDDISIAEKEK